jgi:amidophosphoribosyltransferase
MKNTLIGLGIALTLAVPLFGEDKESDRVENAGKVMQEIIKAPDGIPQSVLDEVAALTREAGAVEVHMRVSSPPYRWPCFYGMDTGNRGELIAASMSVEEIRDYLNVDSLAYLAIDRLLSSTGAVGAGFCDACLTGSYPVEVPVSLRKDVEELKQRMAQLQK